MHSATPPEREQPYKGQELYRNGRLYARVESTRYVGEIMYYEIRRYIRTRDAWAKSTGTYRWRER